ncbi:MAG: sigma-70 family RNA polymerase sigma factor [Myxococcota bacterium]
MAPSFDTPRRPGHTSTVGATEAMEPERARPTMSLVEDKALLIAWRDGDQAAGDRLIRYQFPWISRTVLRWVGGDVVAAMDIVQASFEIALKKKAEITGPFGPYLRGIARLKVQEHFRGHAPPICELTSAVWDDTTGVESLVLGAQRRDLALEALRRLPAEQQDLMALRHVHGLKLREIAQSTGMTVGQVDGILRRAEQRLCREVEGIARSRPNEAEDPAQHTTPGAHAPLRA